MPSNKAHVTFYLSLKTFKLILYQIIKNEGQGFSIVIEHIKGMFVFYYRKFCERKRKTENNRKRCFVF